MLPANEVKGREHGQIGCELSGASMTLWQVAITVALLGSVTGCSTSSSRALTGEPVVASSGPVFVTQAALPASIEYKIIGSVSAEANVGYESVPTLYPLLADEARKLGANAVMSTQVAGDSRRSPGQRPT